MNIFVLDKDPCKAAQMLCDSHVVKMIIESCQLLSTHDRMTNRWFDESMLYKETHKHHPCRTCLGNYANRLWLILHLGALLYEYQERYGKVHKCNELLRKYWRVEVVKLWYDYLHRKSDYDKALEYILERQTLPKCMPEAFHIGGDDIDSVVASYRNYYKYKHDTLKRFKYTNCNIPDWLE